MSDAIITYMKCIKHTQGVYELQDIFTEKEYSFIKYIFENLLEEDWIVPVKSEDVEDIDKEDNVVYLKFQIVENLIKSLFPLFTSHELITMSPKFYRQIEGSQDAVRHDSHDNKDERIFYSAYWFINDDYDGGEFVYWDGTRVKPKSGSMLIHPAGEDYFLKKVTGPTPKYYLFGYVCGNQNWIYAQLNQEKLDKMSLGLL